MFGIIALFILLTSGLSAQALLNIDFEGDAIGCFPKGWASKDEKNMTKVYSAKSGNDNVLGVYVVFGGVPIPKTIKYIWSETLPVGTQLNSPYSSKTKMLVIRSGKEGLGQWFEEERDALADYRALFGDQSAKPTAKGIAVLTDSDNTGGRVVGDYDDFIIE